MFFTNDNKILIKVMRRDKCYSAKNELISWQALITFSSWTDCCRKIDTTVSADRKYGSGRKRTPHTSENIDADEELVFQSRKYTWTQNS